MQGAGCSLGTQNHMYKCSCGFETEKGKVFSAHFKHHKGAEHKRMGWQDPATGELFPTRPAPSRAKGPPPEPRAPAAAEKPGVGKGAVTVAALATTRPPVLFQLGQETIPIDFGELFECYRLYTDIKARGLIGEQSFSGCLLDSIALSWTILVGHPRIEGDSVKLEEVNDGRGDSGSHKEEAGVDGPDHG